MPFGTPFAVFASASCPRYDEMLISLEREFRAVDCEGLAEQLDELARPLFGLPRAPSDERAITLARTAWAALPEAGDRPADWLLTSALEGCRGTGAVRAALAVELGRRAGISARPVRLHGCWAVHLRDRGAHVAADVGADSSIQAGDAATGGLCAHQLAFAVLTGLASAWQSAGQLDKARRACGLRLLLPLEESVRSLVQQEVRAHEGRA